VEEHKHGEADEAEEVKMLSSEKAYSSREIEASSSSKWQCGECTWLNKLDSYSCSACGKLFESLRRHLAKKDRPQPSAMIPKPAPKTYCKACYRKVPLVDDRCKDCKTGQEAREARSKLNYSKASSWDCGSCGRTNEESRMTCTECDHPKERKFLLFCKQCNLRNPDDFPTCEGCFASMRGQGPKAGLKQPRRYLEICGRCHTRNADDLPSCGSCFGSLKSPSISPPRAGLEQPRRYVETCERCRTRNAGDTPLCGKCSSPMPSFESGVRSAPGVSKPSSEFGIYRPSPAPGLSRKSPEVVVSRPPSAQTEAKKILKFMDSCPKCTTPNTRKAATCAKCYGSLRLPLP
jgi:hypothetical protein